MKCAFRSFGCIILALALLSHAIPYSISASEQSVLLGDADGDGNIMIVDCTLIQRDIAALAEIRSDNREAADVDSDGIICILDATEIQRYLAEMEVKFPIGKTVSKRFIEEQTEQSTQPSAVLSPNVSVNGNTVTIDDVTFDTSRIPTKTTITDSKTNSKTLILLTKANLSPEDISIQVNDGVYDHKTDYTDARFKENYLMTSDGKIGYGYDCLVRNTKGEAVAWVEAHYCDGWSDPFRVKIYGMKADSFIFPIEFFYKGVSLKRCEVTVNLIENHPSIESTINEVRSIEKKCWRTGMTDQEKLKAFAQYVAKNYSYSQVYCNIGADYVAFAARDLGLISMLLYPGGEPNQTCGRHLVTYNIYTNIVVPGGHCACIVVFKDGSTLRYDVQGGSYQIAEIK